jgi:formylglycine-generating enzyme
MCRILGLGVCAAAVALLQIASLAAETAKDLPKGQKNSLDMQFVLIQPGEFMMGNLEGSDATLKTFNTYNDVAPSHLKDELPAHRVRITRPYYLGKYEVTRGEFMKFVKDTDYKTEAEADGTGAMGVDTEKQVFFKKRDPKFNWRTPGYPQEDNHPVVNVTWNDAVKFCDWLSKKEGKKYRLPTEAEWEYACRAGTKTRYYFGDDPEELAKHANTGDAKGKTYFREWENSIKSDDGIIYTAPVGTYPANPWGLHDMHGNVWEWTADKYDEEYYAKSPIDDPQGAEKSHLRVRRGGAWHTFPLWVRSSFRNWNTPQTRYLNLGFRVALEAQPK